jgi:signal transduction histidine kinase
VILRPRSLVLGASVFGALFTLLLTANPGIPFAVRNPSLHIALETAAGVIALVAAFLMLGRLRDDTRISDLALTSALAVFAATNLFLAALPAAFSPAPTDNFSNWASLAGRLLGAGLFAYAAFGREQIVRLSRLSVSGLVVLHAAALGGIAATVAAFESSFPTGIDPGVSPASATNPVLAGHPAVHGLQLVGLALFAAAAFGFVRRSERTSDEFAEWLAAAATLAAFAWLNYFLFPSLFSEWLYAGDALRLGAYLMLLIGVAREMGRYWRTAASAAVLEERRRMARDLHDGLAQELAFIVTQSRRLANRGDESVEYICVAAERALDESRRAIAALTRPLDEPLAVVLSDVAGEVAYRVGLRVEFDIEDVSVAPATREALLRIVREAVTNAARHGRASVARIVLSNGHGLHLRIEDDGVGFDPAAARASRNGFGLRSIEERAAALGGVLRIDSRPQGGGTAIEVVIP